VGYWDETDRIMNANGGNGPVCPDCGKRMYPIDDHGRFSCGCSIISDLFSGNNSPVSRIPQVPAGTELTDEQKKEIPPINRLHLPPTEEEQDFFKDSLKELKELLEGYRESSE